MEELAPEDAVEEWSDLSASNLAPGARLGRYELLLSVAYGGMARVWAARQHGQRGFSKTVAIKTILPHLAHNPEFERMFLDEAKIAAGVHHPNVTEIYELGEEGSVLYLAMEWVNGDSLVHLLRGIGGKVAQPIEPRIAARIIADACAGLHAAHELTDDDGHLLNVVHRDVSPHNILVSLEGTVKVTDFGVAKALGQTHQETAAGQVKGKVAYMAPEQIGGTGFDRRADVFGMGCVLYEAITGVRPFRGEGDPQVMQAVLRGTYDPPVMRCKGLAPELSAIIDRALAPEPRMRFATAERMRVALEEWLAKGASVVTATQVGSVVRQRLGPVLEKRREQVKSAMAAMPGAEPASAQMSAKGAGHTPSKSQPGQSRSGVVSTMGQVPPPPMRSRVPSIPGTTPEPPSMKAAMAAPPPPAMAGQAPPLPAPALGGATAAAVSPPATGPTGAKYLIAAIAGVAFALVVGGIALAVLLSMRSRSGTAASAPGAAPTAAPPATITATAALTAPSPTQAPTPVIATTTAAPPAEPPAAPAPTAAGSAPKTVDISDLPTAPTPPPAAKPTWPVGPVPPARPTATTTTPPALPANPY
jgi:serine/threonine-protein kinase